MPDSDVQGELGGLAQSIDAIFSQRPAPPVELDVPETFDAGPAVDELPADAVAEAEMGLSEELAEPDPFESLDAHEDEADEEDAPPELSFADVDAPQEVAWESLEAADDEEGFAPPPFADAVEEDVLGVPVDSVAEVASGEMDPGIEEAEAEPEDAGLVAAIEAFLSGSAAAANEVRVISAQLGERLALDPLADAVERLVHTDYPSRSAEALDLAQGVINPAVASRLVQRMGKEEDEERQAAYVVLSERLGMVMANAFRGALTDHTELPARRAYYDGMLAMGEVSRPVIEAMVEDDNRFLVRNALAMLGEMEGEGTVELVTSALANTDPRVRCEALASLAKLGGEDLGQLVMASLEDSDASVRAAAAVASGELKVERALRPILFLMEDEDDPEVVVPLLNALGSLGDPGAVQAIEKRAVASLFSKPPTEIRVAAYRALHDIGTPHARELVQKAGKDKDPVVRTTARGLAPSE
jgi:HEAT repeat protein